LLVGMCSQCGSGNWYDARYGSKSFSRHLTARPGPAWRHPLVQLQPAGLDGQMKLRIECCPSLAAATMATGKACRTSSISAATFGLGWMTGCGPARPRPTGRSRRIHRAYGPHPAASFPGPGSPNPACAGVPAIAGSRPVSGRPIHHRGQGC
jgi:hypothetical protein